VPAAVCDAARGGTFHLSFIYAGQSRVGEEMRILIVEDEAKMAGLIRKGLRQEAMAADIATKGEDALWMAGSTEYDAIILDLMLPGIDGLSVIRWMRTTGWTPVIMLTALGEETDRIVGLELGADDYVTKPFSIRELLARVRAELEAL